MANFTLRRINLLLLLGLCLNLAAATVARYTGTRIFWDARTPVNVFSSGGYARLIELSDGRLLACCESGGIKISFSSDKGKTWSSPTLIAPNSNRVPNCVPDLIQLADGTIIVGYNPRPSTPYTEDRRFGIRVRRSTDGGQTWSDEIFVYDADYVFENGCWEPSFLELPSGELQLYFADESPYTTTSEQQISLCRSFDGGLTWSAPQRISYRSGYRDGMPVPVLLSDNKNIVVGIEDNGWSDDGDSVPTTVRTTLSNNWKTYVSGSSSMRNRSINYTYCPMAKGGAPYLRVLPNGETVLSHQSTYGDGDNMKMYVYVGNKQAKGFKAMSKPFYQENKGCWWNSLAVIDTGIVVAVGGLDGKISIVKGYPMKQFQVPFGTPQIDGRFSSADTYYHPTGRQIPMGSETGSFSYTDFAYDLDYLYMSCVVFRSEASSEQPYPDGVNLYVESIGASTDKPLTSAYRFTILPNGSLSVSRGNGTDWREAELSGLQVGNTVASSYYRLELAIPWTSIGLTTAPIMSQGQTISVNLETLTSGETAQLVERIPDTQPQKPSTWVLLKLIEAVPSGIKDNRLLPAPVNRAVYNLSGQRVSQSFQGILVQNGRKFISHR